MAELPGSGVGQGYWIGNAYVGPGIGRGAPSPAPSGLRAPGSSSPQGTAMAPQGAGEYTRPLILPLVLADAVGLGASVLTGTAKARIKIPSALLAVKFSVSWADRDGTAVSSYTSSTWTARMIRPGRPGQREAELHTLFSAQTLPQSYGIVDAGDSEILLTCALAIPTVSNGESPPDNNGIGPWILEVQYEPAIPLCPEVVAALYAQCGVRLASAELDLSWAAS